MWILLDVSERFMLNMYMVYESDELEAISCSVYFLYSMTACSENMEVGSRFEKMV